LLTFRQQLGVEVHQYKTMSNFKTYVLDFALKQINELTDITVKYEQHKQGRSISGFSFTLKQRKTISPSIEQKRATPLELFSRMTDKQRHFFNKLSELHEMGKYSQGTESYEQFAVRIAEMLKDQNNFKNYSHI
jgi:plasmid replication initiation protein